MAFDHIERLKDTYTDKYVVIDETRPELLRFKGFTGTVRTVNMSGRALVEFDSGDNNIGWFDIDVDYLKVIDEPLPKPEPKAKPAPKKEEKPAAKKPAAAPAPKAPAGGSIADMLAAQGGGSPPAASGSVADMLAAAGGGAPAKADPPAGGSVADMLAAAGGSAPAAAPAEAPAEESAPEPDAAAPTPTGPIDPENMTLEEMLGASGIAPKQA